MSLLPCCLSCICRTEHMFFTGKKLAPRAYAQDAFVIYIIYYMTLITVCQRAFPLSAERCRTTLNRHHTLCTFAYRLLLKYYQTAYDSHILLTPCTYPSLLPNAPVNRHDICLGRHTGIRCSTCICQRGICHIADFTHILFLGHIARLRD